MVEESLFPDPHTFTKKKSGLRFSREKRTFPEKKKKFSREKNHDLEDEPGEKSDEFVAMSRERVLHAISRAWNPSELRV